MRPVGEHAVGAEGVVCDDAAVEQGWVIIELVDEEGRPRGVSRCRPRRSGTRAAPCDLRLGRRPRKTPANPPTPRLQPRRQTRSGPRGIRQLSRQRRPIKGACRDLRELRHAARGPSLVPHTRVVDAYAPPPRAPRTTVPPGSTFAGMRLSLVLSHSECGLSGWF